MGIDESELVKLLRIAVPVTILNDETNVLLRMKMCFLPKNCTPKLKAPPRKGEVSGTNKPCATSICGRIKRIV